MLYLVMAPAKYFEMDFMMQVSNFVLHLILKAGQTSCGPLHLIQAIQQNHASILEFPFHFIMHYSMEFLFIVNTKLCSDV